MARSRRHREGRGRGETASRRGKGAGKDGGRREDEAANGNDESAATLRYDVHELYQPQHYYLPLELEPELSPSGVLL